MKCNLSPDDEKECAAKVKMHKGKYKNRWVCRVYDEPIKKLKRCPLK